MSAGSASAGDSALVDDGGYPTEWGIAAVRGFHGSPAALVDLLEQMWWTPTLMTVDEWLDGQLRTVVRVSLVTGGWSGNEQLIECLRVMNKRRAALEQQREDIEAMLEEIDNFEAQCRTELARRGTPLKGAA